MVDTNIVILTYLLSKTDITDLVGTRVYAANPLPENATLPAINFFVRGGTSIPQVPKVVMPSIQINCWAETPEDSREVYRAVYDVLNGLGNYECTIDGTTYYISGSIEEVQGQDIQDISIQEYWNTMAFYQITIRNY